MNYLKNFLSSLIIISILSFPCAAISAERADLYKSGLEAYKSKNYVLALKNLYAFYVLNEIHLEKHLELKNKLMLTIEECESILSIAIAYNKHITLTPSKFKLETTEIKNGFSGTAKEIQELLKNKSINIEQMMKNRQQSILK